MGQGGEGGIPGSSQYPRPWHRISGVTPPLSRACSAERPVLGLTRMAKEIHDGGSEGVILLQVHQNLSEPAAIRPPAELAYGVCSDVGWRGEEEEQVYPRTRRKLPKPAHRSARDGHSRIGPWERARWPDAPSGLAAGISRAPEQRQGWRRFWRYPSPLTRSFRIRFRVGGGMERGLPT